MWDKGWHSYVMVEAKVSKGFDYRGRIPSNVKLTNETQEEDGSYSTYIYPLSKLIKKDFSQYS
jgi:hypothetical protein